jgi:hypothetical protein
MRTINLGDMPDIQVELEVSFRAFDKVAYFPPFPTVRAPEGGELNARADKADSKNASVCSNIFGDSWFLSLIDDPYIQSRIVEYVCLNPGR